MDGKLIVFDKDRVDLMSINIKDLTPGAVIEDENGVPQGRVYWVIGGMPWILWGEKWPPVRWKPEYKQGELCL